MVLSQLGVPVGCQASGDGTLPAIARFKAASLVVAAQGRMRCQHKQVSNGRCLKEVEWECFCLQLKIILQFIFDKLHADGVPEMAKWQRRVYF